MYFTTIKNIYAHGEKHDQHKKIWMGICAPFTQIFIHFPWFLAYPRKIVQMNACVCIPFKNKWSHVICNILYLRESETTWWLPAVKGQTLSSKAKVRIPSTLTRLRRFIFALPAYRCSLAWWPTPFLPCCWPDGFAGISSLPASLDLLSPMFIQKAVLFIAHHRFLLRHSMRVIRKRLRGCQAVATMLHSSSTLY